MINKVQSVSNRPNYKQNFGMAVGIKKDEVREVKAFFDTTNPEKWTVDAINDMKKYMLGFFNRHKDDKHTNIEFSIWRPATHGQDEKLSVRRFVDNESSSEADEILLSKLDHPNFIKSKLNEISEQTAVIEENFRQRDKTIEDLKNAGSIFDGISEKEDHGGSGSWLNVVVP